MKPQRINADKPHLWKADIAASVDRFNEWFIHFAPAAFRSTRVKTTERVKTALLATSDLRNIDAATLKANPGALSTLRMCTAPPLAVDRLVGLATASKSLVGSMEKGKLPARMKAELIDEFRRHADGQLALFHTANERPAGAGQPDQSVDRERRGCTHAERRQRAGVRSERRGVDAAHVIGGQECRLDVLGGFDAR